MGLLDNTLKKWEEGHKGYYQGNELGNYQFISLDDIITQFQIAYVGEDKIISKIKRIDVAFHAQRAMQELSFDTFKSIKAHQIDVPPTLVMSLPHDYVNYTKLTWVDSAGIKHPLYPTNRTSNPFQIRQGDDGDYLFVEGLEQLINNDFSESISGSPDHWTVTVDGSSPGTYADINVDSEVLKFSHRTRGTTAVPHFGANVSWGYAMVIWQEIDVTNQKFLDISATGTAVAMTNGPGTLRFGISTNKGDYNTKNMPEFSSLTHAAGFNADTAIFDLEIPIHAITGATEDGSFLKWNSDTDGDGTTVTKELLHIDVRDYDKVYALIVSFHDFTGESETLTVTNYIDDVSVVDSHASRHITPKTGNEKESSTWKSYKSGTPSENQDDYQDDTYWPAGGERYGLDPQHAQANGSFFIDPRLGRIHFSSNISGKTVILDYISDGLGTDAEMQVHKFAEEAMYKSILCAIMSAKANIGRNQLVYYKKDKFAAIRQAKLRLSNIKLEELTRILRGKSKHIKH